MIVVKIHGGLGNQLFEYAAGRRLAHKHGTNLKLDISSLQDAKTKRHFCLSFFNINAQIATHNEIDYVGKIDNNWKRRWLWNVGRIFKITPLWLVREKSTSFESRILNAPNNTYLHGHWQSEKNFKDIEDIIRKELIVKSPQSGKNADMAQIILSTDSVSIHIRRTDYINNESFNKMYNVCDLDYYKRAIDYISKKIDRPALFIFSDDITWAKENLKTTFPITFIDFNDDCKNYEDLRLMSQCKHNIIANSTFSWWGAWLNNNPRKIVIAPKKWFNDASINSDDFIPSKWIKI